MTVAFHFLDSGAYSLLTKGGNVNYREYMDGYVSFVKGNSKGIDLYANVDVIGDPQKTWYNQEYLEDRGLTPMPVVHRGEDLKWLEGYVKKGYTYIGLGGIASGYKEPGCQQWIDDCFYFLCNSSGYPCVKIHGFGVGGVRWIRRYPWASIDTVRWTHLGSRSYLPVPKSKKGEFLFDREPVTIRVGSKPRQLQDHYSRLTQGERQSVLRWLATFNKEEGDVLKPATWYHSYLAFYETLVKELGTRRYTVTRARRLRDTSKSSSKSLQLQTKVYYSGNGITGARPEDLLPQANIMLTYFDMPSKRFTRLLDSRL